MLESPGTLIPSIFLSIFLVFSFLLTMWPPTPQIPLWTVTVPSTHPKLALRPSSVSDLLVNAIDWVVHTFWCQVYCVQEKLLSCTWNPLDGWWLFFWTGPLYLFRVCSLHRMSVCFRLLFTSASINLRSGWYPMPLFPSFGHLTVIFAFLPFGITARSTAHSICCNLAAVLLFIKAHICWGHIYAVALLKSRPDVNIIFLNVYKFAHCQSYPWCSVQTSLSTLALFFLLVVSHRPIFLFIFHSQ